MEKLRQWWNFLITLSVLLISIGFSYFASADTSNPEGFYAKFLKDYFEQPIPVIFVLFTILIIITINEFFKASLKEEIIKLKGDIKQYRELTKDKSLDILINLKDMQKLHKKEKLRELIKSYACRNPYVLAVQIYGFNLKHTAKCTEYRVNYLDGYVRDDEEVNAITQSYYKVNRKIFKSFANTYMDYIGNPEKHSEKLKNFVESQLLRLDAKKIVDITEEDCVIYALVIYLIQILQENEDEIISTSFTDLKKVDILNNKKRTGMLRGIINNDFYKFSYSGEDDNKKNRIYVTFCKPINNSDYLFLITFSPEINTNDDEENEFIKKSVDTFLENSKQFDDMI